MRADDRLRRFFAPDGPLARVHGAWEPREAQLRLAQDALEALSEGHHLVAEAGTGTGKTLAYLVPALLSRKQVIVSTGTRNLQDQLATKDLPFLREASREPFDYVVLKGRDNYLCKYRFDAFRNNPLFSDAEEGQSWPTVLRWADETSSGDRSELVDLPENPSFWPEINAKASTCIGKRCPSYDDCHLVTLRTEAREAAIIVVNHHLYLADATLRDDGFGSVLPDVDTVIFDEAHRLESAATNFFGKTISNWRLRELADDTIRELAKGDADLLPVQRRAKDLGIAAAALPIAWRQTMDREVLPAHLPAAQEDALQLARAAVKELAAALSAQLSGQSAPLERLVQRCKDLDDDFDFLSRRDDPSYVHWSETRGRGVFLTATPVDVSSMLREKVFDRLRATILCSATLAVNASLDHVRGRVGLLHDTRAPGEQAATADGKAVALPVLGQVHESPFDFPNQGLLYMPLQMPAPKDPDFAAACAEQVRGLVAASRGRAFVLFTSFVNLNRVHEMVREDLEFTILKQGDAPKGELLRRFTHEEGSVLMATSSFWEGVDVPGDDLSLVVIDKLPFAVPSDPILAARSRLIEEAGGKPFFELSVPEAVLTLKQGVGRLIRSGTDRGVVAILDPRLRTTRYGRTFLDNLPPLRHTTQPSDVEEFFDAN
jgi:ATP-dependent DNA helicase DinG